MEVAAGAERDCSLPRILSIADFYWRNYSVGDFRMMRGHGFEGARYG